MTDNVTPLPVTELSDAASKMMDLTQLLGEAVISYRTKLVEGGVAASTADTMAKELHTTLLEQLKAGAAKHQAAKGPMRPRFGR